MAERLLRRPARAALAVALVVLLAPLLVDVVPRALHRETEVVSTPVPDGMPQPAAIALGPGQTACEPQVVLPPDGERLRLALRPGAPPPSRPLRVTLAAPGYRFAGEARPDGARLVVDVEPPARPLAGTVCVRNAGTTATQLDATADPRVLEYAGRALVDDVTQPAAFRLAFVRAQDSSPLERLSQTLDRAALFGALGPWAYWLLLPLVLLAVPALVLSALRLALRAEEDGPADGAPR